MPAASSILVAEIGDLFWLRVEGKGTFQNSLQVKRAFERMSLKGVRRFVVDLERCPIMDSTFLGTLNGAAVKMRELGGTVSVLNANPRNLQLITSLSLDFILDVDTDGSKWVEERRRVTSQLAAIEGMEPASQTEQAEHVLEAHRSLVEINEENQVRFQDVIDFLEKELGERNNMNG